MRRGVALSPVEMPWPGSSSATVRMPRASSIAASGRNCVRTAAPAVQREHERARLAPASRVQAGP